MIGLELSVAGKKLVSYKQQQKGGAKMGCFSLDDVKMEIDTKRNQLIMTDSIGQVRTVAKDNIAGVYACKEDLRLTFYYSNKKGILNCDSVKLDDEFLYNNMQEIVKNWFEDKEASDA
jgi:hypothetical protein